MTNLILLTVSLTTNHMYSKVGPSSKYEKYGYICTNYSIGYLEGNTKREIINISRCSENIIILK